MAEAAHVDHQRRFTREGKLAQTRAQMPGGLFVKSGKLQQRFLAGNDGEIVRDRHGSTYSVIKRPQFGRPAPTFHRWELRDVQVWRRIVNMQERLWKWLRRMALPGVFASLAVTGLLVAFGKTAGVGGYPAGVFHRRSLFHFHWRHPGGDFAGDLGAFREVVAGAALGRANGRHRGRHSRGSAAFRPMPAPYISRPLRIWPSFWRSYCVSLILASTVGTFIATFETYRQRLETTQIKLKAKEVERERALKLATAARLSSLESRVHPHFLFNTLNSVASLIHEDPKRAETMVNQLAELLRFSLDSAQGGLVPLEREMKIVEDYLAIEQARFGERLRYSIAIDSGSNLTPIPPLAVQTLVENAVKYAVGPRIQGASIRITAQADEMLLRLEVRDDGPGFSCGGIPAGHGLSNLEERLAAIYGDSATCRSIRRRRERRWHSCFRCAWPKRHERGASLPGGR